MNGEEREARKSLWVAHYLGELPPDERRRVEAELRADPEEAAECERLAAGVRQWSSQATPGRPLDLQAVYSAAAPERQAAEAGSCAPAMKRPRRAGAWALAAAAPALVAFALTQVKFTIAWGDKALHWGQGAAPATGVAEVDSTELAAIHARLDEIQLALRETDEQINSVALESVRQNLALAADVQSALARLTARQDQESRTRYRDVQQLISLTQWDGGSPGEFALVEGSPAAESSGARE
jgi:hypothetical protein